MRDPETLLLRLGQDLRRLRESRGLSQLELAKRAGLPRSKIIQVEKGESTVNVRAYARVAVELGAEFTPIPARRPTYDELPMLFPLQEG